MEGVARAVGEAGVEGRQKKGEIRAVSRCWNDPVEDLLQEVVGERMQRFSEPKAKVEVGDGAGGVSCAQVQVQSPLRSAPSFSHADVQATRHVPTRDTFLPRMPKLRDPELFAAPTIGISSPAFRQRVRLLSRVWASSPYSEPVESVAWERRRVPPWAQSLRAIFLGQLKRLSILRWRLCLHSV